MLRRLGQRSAEHRRLVVGLWVAVVVGIGVLAAAIHRPTDDAFNVPGTEAQRALDLLNAKFPGAGGATARLVFAAPPGRTLQDPRYKKLVDPTVALAGRVPQSVGSGKAFAASVAFSEDHRIAFADLHFLVPVDELKESTKDALRRVATPARAAGLQVEFSGGVTSTATSTSDSIELIGLAAALVILLIAFGTLVTALLPLITALVGVAVGLLGISALTGVAELNSTAPTLATMLGLAVGIDYALFIVSRHREQLAAGVELRESIARAVGSAGGAVCFAGATVVVALAGMVIIGIPFLTVMGLAAAATVVVAVLVALTLLPALLAFAGARAGGGRHVGPGPTAGRRWVTLLTRLPWAAILGVIVVLGVIALPARDLRLGLPDDRSLPPTSTERKAYDLLVKGFGPGFTGPLTVVGDASKAKDPRAAGTRAVDALGTFPDVAAVSRPVFNQDGTIGVVTVTPSSGPASQRTKDLVKLIRARARVAAKRYGIAGYVTGRTAVNIDTSDKISSGLPAFLVVIVGLALVLLMLAFRSLAVPVKAVLGFLLTIAAALGAVTWTFQEGHLAGLLGIAAPSPIVSFLPVLLIAILFGLAMDYEVFLVTRMRESHLRGEPPTGAVISGFTASARVVTAAALIMVSVFAAFVIGDDVVITSIAFSLAFGVLADALLVRMTLVPAVLALLGARAWTLPAWLDRQLPHVDLEGGPAPGDTNRARVARDPYA